MLGLVTVTIPLLNEDWQMPIDLKESLYKYLFTDPAKINSAIYEQWFDTLSEEDQLKVRRIKLHNPY